MSKFESHLEASLSGFQSQKKPENREKSGNLFCLEKSGNFGEKICQVGNVQTIENLSHSIG